MLCGTRRGILLAVDRADAAHLLNIGYVMGLFVGEGTFTSCLGRPRMALKLVAEDPEPLKAVRTVFGGRIHGPYQPKGNRKPFLLWYLQGGDITRTTVEILLNHLPDSRKRHQFLTWVVDHSLSQHERARAELTAQNIQRGALNKGRGRA